ncbi:MULTISPECIES: HAMP domain-containing sensor histidine kinase [Pseudoalteromonas]|uniref:sensor histidine kinase n=1 Tax=Pseudoalteromonas TaxID=53246 RepID=UPI000781EC22|nr:MULTISPECIES: ATP-binding protein [Pseudoalteromonas]MCF7517999.1 ATP-binding protein [Pseudoalteromonas sp. L21]
MQTDPAISRLLVLRSAAIAVQFFAVIAVYFLFEYQIALLPLLTVICIEAVFQLLSIFAYRKVTKAKPTAVLMQLTADLLFLTILLSLSGGATNAFVSLLLLPIMIAAVSVNAKGLAYIAVLAIAAYSFLLIKMPEHTMHQMQMTHHFIGMWINFVISAIVIAFVIGTLNSTLRAREATIARTREQQLRHEQLLTLDGAAAQVTHQLATPIANLQLLFEELQEQQPDDPIVHEMAKPLSQCKEQLAHFRALSNALRTGETQQVISAQTLQKTIQDAMTLHFPEQTLHWLNDAPQCSILSDAMLLPAMLNLLQNAVSANNNNQKNTIEADWQIDKQQLLLSLRDFGQGFSEQQMASLGGQLMPSSTGMGMAVMLSNATLERLNGSLTLYNHPKQGAIAMVSLKIV